MFGELGIISTSIKDKLVKNALVFIVWNTQASTLGGIIFIRKNWGRWQHEKERFVCWICLYCFFHLVLPTRVSFDKFQAEIYDPSNSGNDKDCEILFQAPTIMEDFDTTALEDILNCLDVDLPTS